MSYLAILPYYFIWHYGRSISDALGILKNFLVFIYNFFSIRALFFSLFSPWKRLGETYQKGAGLEEMAGAIVVNVMMRILGAVIRSLFIVTGIIFIIFVAVAGLAFIVVWIMLPVIILYLLSVSTAGILK